MTRVRARLQNLVGGCRVTAPKLCAEPSAPSTTVDESRERRRTMPAASRLPSGTTLRRLFALAL
eukprot:512650-Prymnesium_polylepis.1